MEKIKIGIIREGKVPADSRVVLTPKQCVALMEQYNQLQIVIQPSNGRCYKNEEYEAEGIPLQEDLNDCRVLLGVKEVPIEQLIDGKTYFFFSHTIKKQAYNQKLIKAVVDKKIRLIDYETLVNDKGHRVIAFGHWAGVVGAHNALWTWAKKYGQYNLKRAKDAFDLKELKAAYKEIDFPKMNIAVTGSGRVSGGVIEILEAAGINKVSEDEIIKEDFDKAVYVQLDCGELYARQSDNGFELAEFYADPTGYKSIIKPYLPKIDLFINAIYWNPIAPAYWTLEEMKADDFNIKVIADITCDIAPEASVPSTLKPTTIADPVFGFDRFTSKEVTAFTDGCIDVMSIDNLPNELPRDASEDFGKMFLTHVLPELVKPETSDMLYKATITRDGDLNEPFEYLRDYLEN